MNVSSLRYILFIPVRKVIFVIYYTIQLILLEHDEWKHLCYDEHRRFGIICAKNNQPILSVEMINLLYDCVVVK